MGLQNQRRVWLIIIIIDNIEKGNYVQIVRVIWEREINLDF